MRVKARVLPTKSMMKYTLREYQQRAIDELWGFYRSRKGDGKTHNALIVAPTASGKSILIAAIVKDMIEKFGGLRVLILTHQKELIQQNYEKLITIYPKSNPGIYSASIGQRQTENKIIFAGIQSVYNKAYKLGSFSLILIDEAHTLPKKGMGMYRQFIDDMNALCGKIPVIGLTATPYRLDSGYLHKGDGALFTDIAVDIPIQQLLSDGYLSPVTTKKVGITIDVSGVAKRGGEYIVDQLSKAADSVTEMAIMDAIPRIYGRKTGLVFCVTVAHANHVSQFLNQNGISCGVIHGKTPQDSRDQLLKDLRDGRIRCLANVNCLTTGVDIPNIDFLILLRPTQSAGLYVQTIGRAMRLSEGKKDALVLDYSGNIQRHGPIDAINIMDEKDKDKGGAPVKVCPECESIIHAALRQCPDCGYEFTEPVRELKIDDKPSDAAILSQDYKPEWFDVRFINYNIHKGKNGKPNTLRVDYIGFDNLFKPIAREYICVWHHPGYAKQQAMKWWYTRSVHINHANKYSLSDDDFINIAPELLQPDSILVDNSGKYGKILQYKF